MYARAALAGAAAILFAVVSLRPWEEAPRDRFPIQFLNWDLLCEFYPHLEHTARVMRSGTLPLWNPEEHCGYPHLAGAQTGVLYPPYILFWLCPGVPAALLIHALQLVIAGAGSALLARELGATRGAATLAYVAGAFCAPMALGAFMISREATMCWAPLCLVAVARRRPIALAALYAMAILGGYLPYAVFGALAIAIAGAVLAWQRREVAVLVRALAGIAGGVVLAAALVVPVLELWTQVERGPDLPEEMKSGDAVRARELSHLLSPDPSEREWMFLGTLALCGIVLGAATRAGAPLAVVCATALLYAMGKGSPIYGILGAIPPFSSFRGVRSSLPMLVAAAPALAALGADRLTSLAARRPGRAAAGLLLGAAVAAAVAAAGARAGPLAAIELGAIGVALLASGGRAVAATVVLVTFLRLLLDTASLPSYVTSFRALLEPAPAARAALASIYPARVAVNIGRARAELPGSILLSMAGGGVPIARAGGHPRSLPLSRIERLDRSLANAAMGTLSDPRKFSLLACPYAVVAQPFASPRFPGAGIAEADRFLAAMGQKLVVNPLAVPRAAVLAGSMEYGSATGAPRPARLVALAENSADVDLDGGGAGWLALAEAYYPGWRSWVDGVPAKVEPANVAFRAIAVPAGAHHVHLAYRPVSFRLGLFVSLLAIACAVGAGRSGAGPSRRVMSA